MFEDLKARPSGFTAKEKTKLIVMVSAAAVIGCLVFGLRGCEETTPRFPLAPARAKPEEPKDKDLDLTRLAVRTSDVALDSFDKGSLQYVIGEIRGGALKRRPAMTATPAEVIALDPKTAAGTTIEVVGRVGSLDRDAYEGGRADVDQLWAFALEGDDGKSIVVVHPGSTQSMNGGAPADAYHPGAGSPPIKSGDYVRVRGVYLQQRTGTIGAVALSGPTPVLVGREYRRTSQPKPIAKLEDADWEGVKDRALEDTWSTEEDAYYQVLHWAQEKGHDAILDSLRKKELPTRVWGRDMFLYWSKEFDGDKDQSLPDPRVRTLDARGKVFTTTGVLAYFSGEDWDTIPNNVGDVGRRWKVWLISDYYRNAPVRFDSPFPMSDFEGIHPPPDKGERRQRVRAYGVFYKNATFTPKAASDLGDNLPEGKNSEITMPCFLLLHLEPNTPIVSAPYYQNPFFWSWVGLVIFGSAFFLVMHKIEKRESTQMRDQNLRLKRRRRELDAARAQGAGESPAGPEGAPPSGAPPSDATPPPAPSSP